MTRFNPVESYMLNFEPSSAPMVLIHDDIYLKDSEGKHCYWIEQIVPQTSAPTPQLMRFSDIPSAANTAKKSVADDPMNRYFNDTPDKDKKSKRRKVTGRIVMYLGWFREVYWRRGWTINHGESIMTLGDEKATPPPLGKAVDRVVFPTIRKIRRLGQTDEQRKRMNEWVDSVDKAVKSVLGDRVSDMIEVGTLATLPERQGRGYASALVRVATDRADAQGRSSWLASSNVANRGFYNHLGFRTVYSIPLGKDNPTWTEPPVLVDIMVREYEASSWEKLSLPEKL